MSNQARISKEDFDEWVGSAVTKYFFNFLLREAYAHRMLLASGASKKPTMYETGEDYFKRLIVAETYEQIPQVAYEDTIEEEVDDSEASGT